MFQGFIVFCLVNTEPSLRSCYLETAKVISETEGQCTDHLAMRLNSLPSDFFDTFRVEEVGCHQYLKQEIKT